MPLIEERKAVDQSSQVAEMRNLNSRQKTFYDTQVQAIRASEEKKTTESRFSNEWAKLRGRMQTYRTGVGVTEHLHALHKDWMGDLSNKSVLDLGCFNGNALTGYMARSARQYVGMDLSEDAIAELSTRLLDIPHADALAGDFLENSFETNSFDLIYARSVLHHFKYLPPVLEEIKRILKPGGQLITFDPLKTEPLNFVARAIYRPFQVDRQWEHPFSRRTLRLLARNFRVSQVRGIEGLSKAGYVFMPIPGLSRFGAYLSAKGFDLDKRYATSMSGLTLLCWQITMLLLNEE